MPRQVRSYSRMQGHILPDVGAHQWFVVRKDAPLGTLETFFIVMTGSGAAIGI